MGARGIVTLCVALGLLCKAKALSLSQTNSTPGASNQGDEASEFYEYQGRRCKMCPAGSYVSHHCEITGTESTCQPCSSDSFTSHWNSFHACFPCKICRSLDQVERTPCTRTRDAVCACKEGTFCSPDLPCETCHKCRPRCPDGEEMVQHCTPQSDVQCLPIPASSPTPSPGTNNFRNIVLPCIIIVPLGVIFLVGCIFLVCKWKKNPWRCFRGHTRTRTIQFKTLLWLPTKLPCGALEREDNERNTQVDLESQQSCPSHPAPSATRQLDETTPLQAEECPISPGRERRKLVPANGKDPADALQLSFMTFVKEVPVPMWRFYMMVLGLTDNEIETAKANAASNITEQSYQMLRKWQEKNGKEASLDTLLNKLCDPTLELKGVEIKIREFLISNCLYVYEVYEES